MTWWPAGSVVGRQADRLCHWHDRFEERVSNAAAYAEFGSLLSPLHDIVGQGRHFRLAQNMSILDRVHGDLELLQQSLAAEVVAECLTKFHGSLSKFWGNLAEACDKQDPLLEHWQQFQCTRSSPHSQTSLQSRPPSCMCKTRRGATSWHCKPF